jgi:hypothetical protein
MSAPVVVREVLAPAREPGSGVISRTVLLSDGTHQDQMWNESAWVLAQFDAWMLGNSTVFSADDLVRLGIVPPDPLKPMPKVF